MTAPNPEKKACILLVEDNPGDVDLLRMALETAAVDCTLTVIEDGGEAMAFLLGQGEHVDAPIPDLAILDLNIPKSDGIEILEAIRTNPRSAGVLVAVLSSSSSPRERARIHNFGVGLYITKPSDLDEYLKIGSTLKTLLADKKSQPG
jgi:two-component system response regulator